jgi:hypothetical protein
MVPRGCEALFSDPSGLGITFSDRMQARFLFVAIVPSGEGAARQPPKDENP